MKALTLWPEWLWVIRYLGKRVENRRWKLPTNMFWKPVLLHAGMCVGGGKVIQGLEWVKAMAINANVDCVRDGDCLHFTKKIFSSLSLLPSGLVTSQIADVKTTLQLHLRELNLGKIVGVTVFSNCHQRYGKWCVDGQWQWEMAYVRFFLEPVPCRGWQKLWNVSPEIMSLVEKQLLGFSLLDKGWE